MTSGISASGRNTLPNPGPAPGGTAAQAARPQHKQSLHGSFDGGPTARIHRRSESDSSVGAKSANISAGMPPRSDLRMLRHASSSSREIRSAESPAAQPAGVPAGPSAGGDTEKRMLALQGRAIDPAVATAIMEQSDDVDFDGIGRIAGFSTTTPSSDLLDRLESAVIESLTTTNSPAPREAPRTERELLTRAMHLLGMSNSELTLGLLDEARRLFLSGSMNRETVAAFLEKAALSLGSAEDVLLANQFNKLSVEISKPVTTTQQADNLPGRTFETILVDGLVRHPPAGVLQAAHDVGLGVMTSLASYPEPVQQDLLARMASKMNAKPRPWFGQSPSMKQFVESPSIDTLKACLSDTSNGVEAIKVPFIAMKMALAIKDVGSIRRPSWLTGSDLFYALKILPEKTAASHLKDVQSSDSGNLLHHHPKPTPSENALPGYSYTYGRLVPPDQPTGFQQAALSAGQSVVAGPSGTTSMMAFFGQHLAKTNPGFSQEDHLLNTLMFVVFDGGHSTHEVLATLDALNRFQGVSKFDPGASTAQVSVADYAGGYEAIAELGSPETKAALRESLARATELTVEHIAKHLA